MGWERYQTAVKMLEEQNGAADACFEILKKTSQTVCPTVVSMVFDPAENRVFWCENREWEKIQQKKLGRNP